MKNGKIQNNKTKSNKKPTKTKDSDKIVKGAYRITPNDNKTSKNGKKKGEQE
jgi:hypothetical protein